MLKAFRNLMTVGVAVLKRKFHNTSTKFAFYAWIIDFTDEF